MGRSRAETEGITVEVNSTYVPERSQPQRLYYFAYHVRIANVGTEAARLVSRHWTITDGNGLKEEVKGPGVVGEQPRLEPGQVFEYASACPLSTTIGSMRGTYRMVRDDGTSFEAEIAPFALVTPGALN